MALISLAESMMDALTSSTSCRCRPLRDEPELPSTRQTSNAISSQTLTHQMNSSFPAQTLIHHQINNSFPAETLTHQKKISFLAQTLTQQRNSFFPAQTLTHQINNSLLAHTQTHQINNLFPAKTPTHQINNSLSAQTPTHQINNSFSAQTPTHQINNSLSAQTPTHQINNSLSAQKLISWKQLKELKDTHKSAADDSLSLIPVDQGQSFPPGRHRPITAWQLESDDNLDKDRISSVRGQADNRACYDSLDNNQSKDHDATLNKDVQLIYKGDVANSSYSMHSNLPAHSDNNISRNTFRNSKFLEESQTKVSKWQSEMMNKSFCLDLYETSRRPSTDLQMNKAECQSHNYLHLKRNGCQSKSDLNLNNTSCQLYNDLHFNKDGRRSLNGLRVNTNLEPETNLCNLLVETESSLPLSSQLSDSGPVSVNTKMPSLSSELLHFRKQTRQCKNYDQHNTNITASPLKQNAFANQNMINNMFDVKIKDENLINTEKNIKNSSPFICHSMQKNKYNNVRYRYFHDMETHSDKFYFNSSAKTCPNNRSHFWEDNLSNISSLKIDIQETSMTPDSLMMATDFPRTGHEHRVGDISTTVWSDSPMIDLGCNVPLSEDKEFINSNLNAKECGDAPSGDKESSPINHTSNRLLFLDYLLKSEEESSKPKRLNVGFKRPRQINKGSILTQHDGKNKDCFLKGILSVTQMKPLAKANISKKRNKNLTNVKRIVTNACTSMVDDSKSTSNTSVKSEACTPTVSETDSSHSTSSASLSLDSLQSCTSKKSSEDTSCNSSSMEQKLALNNSKKYTYKRSREMKPYEISQVSSQYVKGCLFLNKVITDNFNLLQLSACNGESRGNKTDASIESDYHENNTDILHSEEKLSLSTTNETSNSESTDELLENLSTSTPENANVKCNDYIIEIMRNTIISDSDNMYMTSIFKPINKNPSIKLLNDTEEKPDIEKSFNKVLPLALRAGETPVNAFGKVQAEPSEKSLEQISVLGQCHDSEAENTKSRCTSQAINRPLVTKHKGPFVCNPSRTALQLLSGQYLGHKRRQYKCFSISKSRLGPCFKRFTHRPQRLIRVMPPTALPLTTITVQRTEGINTLRWQDQVKTYESSKPKSNFSAFPAQNSSRQGKRQTCKGDSKNRKRTPSTRRPHSKGINVTPRGLVGVRNQCPSTGHFLGNINKGVTTPKCRRLIVRHYRLGQKNKSLYSRNPRVVIARPLGNSKKKTCAHVDNNRYSRSQTPGNVRSTPHTAKSHAPRAFNASGEPEPFKNAHCRSKSSTPRRDPLKTPGCVNEKSENIFKQCEKWKSSTKQHNATDSKIIDTNRPALNSLGKKKHLTHTCNTILFPEASRKDVTAVSVAKIPNIIPEISSLKENPESRNVFSRLHVTHSKCIGDVSSICCQLLSDIKQNSASYGFYEDDVKCLWMLNKQFKSKDNNNKAKKAGTEINRTMHSHMNKKHSEIDIISNYKGVISCIRAIITKQNVSLRAIDDVIRILETEESAANTLAVTMPLEVSKGLISCKEKPKDCTRRQENSHCSKNKCLKDGNKGVGFYDLPRCPPVSTPKQQCNLRPEQFSGQCCRLKSTRQEKSIVSTDPGSKTQLYDSSCTKFYRSPFTMCGGECNK